MKYIELLENQIKVRNEVTDFYKGQMNGTIWAMLDNILVGYLDWQKYENEILIAYIKVADDNRRQGIGTKMLDKLKEEFPNDKINTGYTTDKIADKFFANNNL